MRDQPKRCFALLLAWFGGALGLPAQTATEAQIEFNDAVLQTWIQADYPPAAKKAKLEGEVLVQFVVEADGSVSRARAKESSDEQFEDPAIRAVSRWSFRPAVEEGKPVASGMVSVVKFEAAQWKQKKTPIFPPAALMPRPEKITPAKELVAPDPEYPEELEELKLPGEVQMEFTVDSAGAVRVPRVQWASHAAFVETAIRAVEKTRFEPAHQGLVPKASTKQYPVKFSSSIAKRSEVLTANHLVIIDDTVPGMLPQPFVLPAPVYPFVRLLAGEAGTATAEFTLGENGQVSAVSVTMASEPEFGAALRAAVETWMLRPALNGDGVRVASKLRVVYPFTPPTSGAVVRLLTEFREGAAGVSGAAGLDAQLKPLWRGFPVYPETLRAEGAAGEAEIEFIIDRGGRVRLPRVKSATREEFGWAAAMAICQWVFEPPRRRGEPVDVRVSIPMEFAPPAR